MVVITSITTKFFLDLRQGEIVTLGRSLDFRIGPSLVDFVAIASEFL